MAAFEVSCPQCGMKLKVPDRTFLGKKAKCGGCEHRFVIEEPTVADEVQFQLAQPGGDGSSTMVGVFARYVSDEPASTPRSTGRFAPTPAANVPDFPDGTPQPAAVAPGPNLDLLSPAAVSAASSRAPVRRKRRGNGVSTAMVLLIVAAVIGGGAYYAMTLPAPVDKAAGKSGKTSKSRQKSEKKDSPVASEPVIADLPLSEYRPTDGAKPIELLNLPGGAYAFIHVRPADLWAKGGTAEELLACLGPFGKWAEAEIERVCLTPAAEIEDALFALIPTTKGEPPEIAVVVRTRTELKRSALFDKFDGEQMDDLSRPYVKGAKSAYVVADSKTYAICPASLASEMVDAASKPAVVQDSLQDLLYRTDRSQPLSVVFMPAAVREDAAFIAPVGTSLLGHLLDWIGDDVEAVAWSMHVAPRFESRLLLRNAVITTTKALASNIKTKLKQTPHDLLAVVEQTHPKQLGRRKVIGRFPAMTQVFAKSTRMSTGPRLVALETELPERAGPNLALASLLTWDVAQQPDYGTQRAKPSEAAPSAEPADAGGSLADRLKKVISVDFRDEFLYSALDFIGEDTATKFKLEGNDLKMAGITQNERQTFKMENQPATAILFSMLDKKGLCVVLDEKARRIIVTTKVAAKEKGLTPFPLEPPK